METEQQIVKLDGDRIKVDGRVYILEQHPRVTPAAQYDPMNANKSLALAKAELRESWRAGKAEKCACCGQLVKQYKRKLSSSMAYGLIVLYKAPPDWINIEEYFHKRNIQHSIRGDVRKLRHFGLIQKNSNSRNGEYRISEAGRQFVEGKIKVRSHYKEFNGQQFGQTGELITIRQALDNKFDYTELMSK